MSNKKKPFEEMTDAEKLLYYSETYGTPKETPSLSADAQYQQQSHRLDEYYNAQSEAYKQSKAQQKEDAYVLYQRMQKYVPEYLKSLGMTGLGVSETYASQATNDYQNNLSAIEQAYARDQSALDLEKFDRQSELEAAYATQKGAEQESLYANVYFPKYEELITELQLEENKGGGYVAPESINKVKQWIESVRSEVGEAGYKEMMANLEQHFGSAVVADTEGNGQVNNNAQTGSEESKVESKPTTTVTDPVNINGNTLYPAGSFSYYVNGAADKDTTNKLLTQIAAVYGSVENIPTGIVYKVGNQYYVYMVNPKTGEKLLAKAKGVKEK